jgi:Tfp pilus assembly protein PilV
MLGNFKKNNKGFLMIEVLVVASIITVSVLAILGVAERSLHASSKSAHTAQAVFLLEEGVEAVKILRDNSWNNISSLTQGVDYYPSFSGGTWILSSTPSQVGIFTRTVSITSVNRDASSGDISVSGTDDPGTKLVTVTVTWTEGSDTVSKILSFYIFDIFS